MLYYNCQQLVLYVYVLQVDQEECCTTTINSLYNRNMYYRSTQKNVVLQLSAACTMCICTIGRPSIMLYYSCQQLVVFLYVLQVYPEGCCTTTINSMYYMYRYYRSTQKNVVLQPSTDCTICIGTTGLPWRMSYYNCQKLVLFVQELTVDPEECRTTTSSNLYYMYMY